MTAEPHERTGAGGLRLLRRLTSAVLCAALLGCAVEVAPPRPAAPPRPPQPRVAAQPPQSAPPELRDIQVLPQRVEDYFASSALDAPLVSAEVQARAAARLRRRFFAPWRRTAPAHSRADALWGLALLRGRTHYGENLRPLDADFAAKMRNLIRPEGYPNTLRRAVATADTSLRVLPTMRPGFLDPKKAGEGYPFDYFQNSGLLAGTPLFVTHMTSDGAWALVEGPRASGWTPISDIAFVDDAFVNAWEAAPLAAITVEDTPVSARFAGAEEGEGGEPLTLFLGRIGMLLPLSEEDAGGVTVLAPARRADGDAESLVARLPRDAAEPIPLALTPRAYARLADQLMGQPYGWGGYLGDRDCSALLLDLYAPFGIFLPRNSSQQARSGLWQPFAGASPQAKEALILSGGRPLLTLLHKPGHIMLYLGGRAGRAVMLHDLWGLHTKSASGVDGRFLVGRVAVTTVSPGAEDPDVVRAGVLLDKFDGMTQMLPAEAGTSAAQ